MPKKVAANSNSFSFEKDICCNNYNEISDFFLSKRKAVSFPEHIHSFFELEIIMSDFGTTTFNGISYPVKKGLVYISRPTDSHSLDFKQNSDTVLPIWNMSFKESFFPQELTDSILYSEGDNIAYLDETSLGEVCALFDIVYRRQNSNDAYSLKICTLCAESMLRIILRNMPDGNPDVGNSCIFKALRYIQTHFKENISQEDVARFAGLSTPYFSMIFAREIGCGYKEYLTQLRVSYAKKLIKNSGYRASDACYEAGFNSYSSFLKAFSRIVGISPTQYVEKRHGKGTSKDEN